MIRIFFLFMLAFFWNCIEAQENVLLCTGDSLTLTLETDSIMPDSVQWAIWADLQWEPLDSAEFGEPDGLLFEPGLAQEEWNGTSLQATAWIADTVLNQSTWILEVIGPPPSPAISTPFPDSIYCYGPGTWEANKVLPDTLDVGHEWNWYVDGDIVSGDPETLSIGFLESNFSVQSSVSSSCGTTFSNTIEVEVLSPLSLGTVGESQVICDGEPLDPLESSGAFGGSGTWQYQWETSVDGGLTWTLAASDNLSFTPDANNGIILSRFSATDVFGCGTVTSSVIAVEEYAPLVAGEIQSSADTLCFGFGSVFSTTQPEGGSGTFTWMWTFGTDTTTLSGPVGFSTMPSVSLDSIEATTYAQVTYTAAEGCGTVQSDWIEVIVLPELMAPVIEEDNNGATVCFGFDGPAISIATSASGADGQFNLIWQGDTGTGWVDLEEQAAEYTPENMETPTSFQVLAESLLGCGTVASNIVAIDVYPPINAGTISGAQTVCHLDSVAPLFGTPASGGGDDFSVLWYQEYPEEAMDSPDAESYIFTPNPLSDTTSFYLQYTSTAGCGTVQSNSVTVEVLPELIPGSLLALSTDTLCHMGTGTISATTAASGVNMNTQWFSNESGVFQPLNQGSNLTYQWSGADSTSSFYVAYTSIDGCGTVASDTIDWPVYPPGQPASIDIPGEPDGSTICYGFDAPAIELTATASGASEGWTYEWQTANSPEGPWSNAAPGPEGLFLTALTENQWIQLNAIDQANCAALSSNTVFISVLPSILAPSIPNLPEICSGADFGPVTFEGASGANGAFDYLWIVSTADGDSSLIGPDLTLYEVTVDTDLQLIASSTLGCGSASSPIQTLAVSEPLGTSVLTLADGLNCMGDTVSISASNPSGGLGLIDQVWYVASSGIWSPLSDASGTEINLILDTSYAVTALLIDQCGTVATDTINITAWPLPTLPNVVGDVAPCSGSTDNVLIINNIDWQAIYNWEAPAGADITSGSSSTQILLDIATGQEGNLMTGNVTATHPTTGCFQTAFFDISVSDSSAPSPAEIVQMPGQDVLVCSDDHPCAIYTWGWRDPNTGWDTFISGETEQYAVIPNFDPQSRWYFVDVKHECAGDESTCITRSWFNHDPFVDVDQLIDINFTCYPNPSSDVIYVQGHRSNSLSLLNTYGQLVRTWSATMEICQFNIGDLPPGIYLLREESAVKQRRQVQLMVH